MKSFEHSLPVPQIWVPKRKLITSLDEHYRRVHEQSFTAQGSLSGHYRIWKIARGERRLVADFDNLITNIGMNRVGVNNNHIGYCAVGSGSATPAVTDSSLSSYIGYTSNVLTTTLTYVTGTPDYVELAITFRFAAGVATGTLAEVGIYGTNAPPAGFLFSRALIVDSGGSPTTITVLSDESLDVEYRIRWYPPQSDSTGSLTLNGITYNYTLRAASVSAGAWSIAQMLQSSVFAGGMNSGTSYGGAGCALGARTSVITGYTTSDSLFSSQSPVAYVADSYYIQSNATASLTTGNVAGGHRAWRFSYYGSSFQALFDGFIPKDSTKVMTFSTRVSWARHV